MRQYARRTLNARPFVLALAALAILSGCRTSMYEYSVRPYEYSGVRIYQVFCSGCHGLTGRGDGPVESYMRGGVPDLTLISKRNGGKFPEEKIHAIIDGRAGFQAHGTSAMPVWGFEFHAGMGNDALAHQRTQRMVDRLTAYLQSIQPGYDD